MLQNGCEMLQNGSNFEFRIFHLSITKKFFSCIFMRVVGQKTSTWQIISLRTSKGAEKTKRRFG